ncbi:NTP transferase domain-containing protein [Candidatus Nanohaloarchaea archaeon]|nr:NTP transferase domain-containing protein [Candidatus Nanohaloarchaea archaeon]
MKAVIPCAKKKEGMFPFSETKPTALLPVRGKPLVQHLIRSLEEIGVDDIYLVTNHLEEQFEERFEEYTNINIVHQEELGGTADAVKACNFIEEDFFVVNGDVMISETDLQNLKDKHDESGGKASILAAHEDKPEKFGVLSIRHDQVNSITEKPEEADNSLVNSGIYILNPEIFDTIEGLESSSLTDAVSEFAEKGEAYFEMIENYWLDIGGPRKLQEADRIKREEISETEINPDADVSQEAEIVGDAVVEPGAEVKEGTVIEGKCYIGENTVVGPNTVIRNSTVGESAQVRNAEIDGSILFEENIVDPFVMIEGCIIGEEGDFKSGSVIRESFIGARSFVDMNNSIRGVKFVPDARTDLSEISK